MGPCFSYDSSISSPCLSLHNIPSMYFPIPSNENALVIVIKSLYSPEPDLRCQPTWIFKEVHKDRGSQCTVVCTVLAFNDR